MATLVAHNLTKAWSSDTGLFDLDFGVEPGEIVALIGPSGSGKTTAVRLFTGLISADSGTVKVLDVHPRRMGAGDRARMGYLPQENVLYPTLTIRENLRLAAAVYGIRRRDRDDAIDEALELVDLSDADDTLMHDASGGMRRRASLAAALVHRPELLFLDEPTAGLDPVLRRSVWDHFIDMKESGTSLVITTQIVSEAAYCDKVGVLREGRLLALMGPEELRSDAYGGELLDVHFETPPSEEMLDAIAARIDGDWEGTGPRSVRFVVADSGTASPIVSDVAETHGASVVESERFVPEFDDVFVEIVQKA